MTVRAEHRWVRGWLIKAAADEKIRHHHEIAHRDALTLASAVETIIAGHILHVRSERLPGRRRPRRDPMPLVDLTVGPDALGAFLLVDYATIRSGEEQRHAVAEQAIRQVRLLLGWERLRALRHALLVVHGPPEQPASRFIEDARMVARGAALSRAFGHKAGITGPIFGPSGTGRSAR